MKNHKEYTKNWPIDGLESIKNCPVCGATNKNLLCDDLHDYFFECAPGTWKLYGCEGCNCAYLDPRPNRKTIGIAYSNYYTHIDKSKEPLTSSHNLWHRLRDDYLSKEYNFQDTEALWPGRWLVHLLPFRKLYLDNIFTRNLPKKSNFNQHVLDVGCGNGDFLSFAKKAGWKTRGIDFDPMAVKIAQSRGLNVTEGSIDSLHNESQTYDFITLSHVLEHVPDPIKMLEDCYKLLKSGGALWIETPNINSNGFKIFHSYWRGIEPPRHFVLFNRSTLIESLIKIGFIEPSDKFTSYVTKTIWQQSKEISRKANQKKQIKYSYMFLKLIQVKSLLLPDSREFITMSCSKPKQ